MFGTIGHIMKKEFIQTSRDRRMFAIIFLAPVMQTVVFGFAINMDLKAQPMVVADLDRSDTSRQLVSAIVNDDSFSVAAVVDDAAAAEAQVVSGGAALALLIPRNLENNLQLGSAEVLLVMDGSDSNTALRAGQESTQILNQRNVTMQQERVEQMLSSKNLSREGVSPELKIETRAWFNPQMRTAVFFVPAVFGLVLVIITMLLTSMGLTREKETGTLEQVMVTPIRPLELMLGKTLPFAILGLIDVGFIVTAASVIFDIPVRGSVATLFCVSALFLMTTLGMGLFISTVSATQQQAMLVSFSIILPAIMLSGYVYPIENMPLPAQWLALLNPLSHFIRLTRGIIVKGSQLSDLWSSVGALALLGGGVLIGAALRFHKRNS